MRCKMITTDFPSSALQDPFVKSPRPVTNYLPSARNVVRYVGMTAAGYVALRYWPVTAAGMTLFIWGVHNRQNIRHVPALAGAICSFPLHLFIYFANLGQNRSR